MASITTIASLNRQLSARDETKPQKKNKKPKLPKGVQLPNTIPNKLKGSQNELNTPKCLPEKWDIKVTSMSIRVYCTES